MFSLIITVISIALVTALALATIYYGGSAYKSGQADASAAKAVLQSQQLLGAAEVFYAAQNRWPDSLAEMVSLNYLQSIPVATLDSGSLVMGEALAAGTAWQLPVAGQPTFTLAFPGNDAACQAVNNKTRGKTGIYNLAYTDYATQCFGSSSATLVIVASKAPQTLATVLPTAQVATGSPSASATGPEWFTVPSSVVAGTVTPAAPVAPTTTAAWSTTPVYFNNRIVTAPTSASLTATVTGTASAGFMLYMVNTGTTGAQSTGFTLSGDVSVFKFRRDAFTGTINGFGARAPCLSGGVFSADGLSDSPCLAAAPVSGDFTAFTDIQRYIIFSAPSPGTYHLTVTPTSDNGTALPGAITLTGTSAFNPTAVWSSTNTSTIAPSLADLTFPSGPGTKTIYLRNTGIAGGLSVGYTMSGDIGQFQVTGTSAADAASPVGTGQCYSINNGRQDGNISGSTQLPCGARDPNSNYPETAISFALSYQPTVSGTHTVTLTPTTDNGTVLPGTITFKGTDRKSVV